MLSITRVLIVLPFSLSALGRGIAHAGAVAPAGPDSGRIVVMISVDGLAAYYLDDPKAEMPTIRALAAAGARATMMKASTPTVTWPNHPTLVDRKSVVSGKSV